MSYQKIKGVKIRSKSHYPQSSKKLSQTCALRRISQFEVVSMLYQRVGQRQLHCDHCAAFYVPVENGVVMCCVRDVTCFI